MRIGLKSLAPGTYRVRWHALSVDTHTTEGSFSFTRRRLRDPRVGQCDGRNRVNDPLIFVRAIHFAATLSVAGVVFFHRLRRRAGVSQAGGELAALAAIVRPRLAWIAWLALPLTRLSGAAGSCWSRNR